MENLKEELGSYKKLQDKLTKKVNPFFHGEDTQDIYEQLACGNSSYLKYSRIENAAYDPKWIEEIEDCIYDLGLIVKNPRSVTQTVGDVVPVELARKTNSESVQHLATHSQYVKEITNKGDVIPNKILNIGNDDFFKTYENRFIATLIRKLVLFIEKRVTFIEENTAVRESEVLYYKNKTTVNGRDVEIETKVKVIGDIELSDEDRNTNEKYAARVEELRRYILYYYNSDFMKMLKTEKNVRNPILMTNIIRKNPVYNHCYRLYKFIEKYELLGVEFNTSDKYEEIDQKGLEEINNAMMTNFLVLRGRDFKKGKKVTSKSYKPKIITNVDDEMFVYGPWVQGPFEFARIDESYFDHLDKVKDNIPESLTKEEKKYFTERVKKNRTVDEEKKQLKKIVNRKQKEAKVAEKFFEKTIAKREAEQARAEELERRREIHEVLTELEKARIALKKDNDLISKKKLEGDEAASESAETNESNGENTAIKNINENIIKEELNVELLEAKEEQEKEKTEVSTEVSDVEKVNPVDASTQEEDKNVEVTDNTDQVNELPKEEEGKKQADIKNEKRKFLFFRRRK